MKLYYLVIFLVYHDRNMTHIEIRFFLSISIFSLISPTWSIGHSIQFLNLRQSVRLLGRGSARRKAATYTGQHKHKINADKYPCLEWDSNPGSQRSSERRHFMP
jgi:hypothetical protein